MINSIIYEKFVQDSDPIKDLGIGIKDMWKKQKNKLWRTPFLNIHKKYFSKYHSEFNWQLCEAFCDIVYNLMNEQDPQTAYDNACENYDLLKDDGSNLNNKYRKILAKVANKEFHIKVSLSKKVNEKFTQDSDPIKDLGIGIITFENVEIGDIIICVKPSPKFTFNDDTEFPKYGVYFLYSKKIYPDGKLNLGFLPYGFLANLYAKTTINNIRNVCKTGDIPRFYVVHSNTAVLKEWEKHFRIMQRKELREYGVYESINEKFTQESDPIEDMNIGIKNKILNDLKPLKIEEKDIIIKDDGTIKYRGYYKPSGFLEVQMRYMPNEKKEFVKKITEICAKSFTPNILEECISEAFKNNISSEDIKDLSQEFGSNEFYKYAKIIIEKLSRTKKQIKHDNTHNIYIFIGFNEKVPIEVKGKKYYEDSLGTESIVKIDKFNYGDNLMVSMAKIRARAQYFDQDGEVYMIELPKEVLDGDRYEKIPDYLYDIFDKYKRKI
jgi:hypothetical protein